MTQMMKLRRLFMIFVVVLIIIALLYFDYSDISIKTNMGSYIGIAAGLCTFLALYLSNKHEKKKVA
jgi:predicted membrane metal-binding protein